MATREQLANFARRLNNSRDRLLSISPSYVLAVLVPPCAILVLATWATLHFLEPLPPRTLKIAVGNARGAYADDAARYAKVFAAAGVKLEVVSSGGAADSLALLHDAAHGVDAAIVQDGLAEGNSEGILSAGAIGYEPVWVFYRSPQAWSRLSDLAGKRVSIGRWGAGTQPFALELLREAGLTWNVEAFTPPGHNIRLITESALDALAGIKEGRIDAVITLGDPDSPVIQAYFHTPGLRALPLTQADAISSHRPFLHHVHIPRGGIDLPSDLPDQELDTLATTSVVYVRQDLHPALVTLLASAMMQTHQDGTLLGRKHEFPNDLDVTVPEHPVAARYFRNGPSFLLRYLPFWLATLLDRTLVVVIPVFALLLPLSRTIPQLYAWRMRARLDRWYAELKFLEAELERDDGSTDRNLLLDRTGWIEQQLSTLRLPLSFSNQLYVLKEHLELVRRRILRSRRPLQAAPETPAASLPLAD